MNVNPVRLEHILITGGAGYLATKLIAQLQDTNCRITRLDRPGARFTPLTGKAQVLDIEGDIGQDELRFMLGGKYFDDIVHDDWYEFIGQRVTIQIRREDAEGN